MDYAEQPPPPVLSGFVERLWRLRVPEACVSPLVYRVVADGCANLAFDCTGAHAPLLTYSACSPTLFDLHPVDIVGARLMPGAISKVAVEADMTRLVGATVALPELQSKHSALMALSRSLLLIASDEARLNSLAQALERVFFPFGARRQRPLATDFTAILSTPGQRTTMEEHVYQAMQLGARQGRRLILRETGLSPKRLARVVRFQQALREMMFSPTRSLAAVAANHGYCDQAHLARESLAFAGIAPSVLRRL